jgi:hypothetical protein
VTIAQKIGARSADFVGACRYLLLAKGSFEAATIAQKRGATPGIVEILKTAVEPASSADATFASPLVPYSSAFAQTLAGLNAFDTIWAANAFQRTPLKCRVMAVTLAATGASPGEGVPKPISRFTLSQSTLEPTKSVCTVVVTNEVALLTTEAAFAWLSEQLRKGLARATDIAFVDAIVGDGSVDSVPSSGSTLSAIASDLATAMALINLGAPKADMYRSDLAASKVYLIAPPKWIRVVALMRTAGGAPAFPELGILGGSISGIAVLPSDALTDKAILLDASQCAVDAGPIIPDKSTQSALQLDDDPSSGTQNLTSLWQNNLTALRLERYWGFALLSSDAAVTITNLAIDQGTGT